MARRASAASDPSTPLPSVASTPDAPARLDPSQLRADFPALHQEVNGHPLVYLDNAATSQKPRSVIEAVERYYREDNANVHRGIHELSRRATIAYEDARARVADWIGAGEASEVVWTRGTTEAINLVAYGWALDGLREDDEIVLTEMEHHSNIVPWQIVAARTGARLRYVGLDDEGRLRLDELHNLLGARTKLVAFNHVSNALGTVNPAAEIVATVREGSDAVVLIDGAQSAPHLPVDVQDLGADFYAFSGHKMCGPTGIGALWARRELLEAMAPFQGGGEMIRVVEKEASSWADVPHKFEAGTPNIAGAVGMAAAVDYLESVGWERIEAHERALAERALERLGEIPGIRVFGPSDPAERLAVVSFTLGDAHPHDISTILDTEGVAIRAGHHCAQPLMRRLGVPATVRASIAIYNNRSDVDALVDALGEVQEMFG